MLRLAGGQDRPALRLLVLHDDPVREFDYVNGTEQALERVKAERWTVISVKNDWGRSSPTRRQVGESGSPRQRGFARGRTTLEGVE
jgi:hypothetical protein